ncbi:MAG: TolC family protein, partial [Parvularculaceae bacterium]|nr:TolC family protein [Parvularculaceae bacterium]
MFRGGAAVVALALAGCGTVDKDLLERQAPPPPAAWAAADNVGGVPTGDWVAAFGDKQLTALVGEAMERNNSLLQAAANLDAARASARVVLATLLPTVNASPRATRSAIVTDPSARAQVGSGAGSLQSNRVYVNNYSLGAQASWEIDLWGRLRDNNSAAWRDAAASLADYQGRRLSIAGAVAQSWFQLIQARQQRELSDRDVAARERNLAVIERRYESGVATSLDVRLARSALGSSKAQLALNQRVEAESARALEVLLGRYPKAEIEAAEKLPDLPPL